MAYEVFVNIGSEFIGNNPYGCSYQAVEDKTGEGNEANFVEKVLEIHLFPGIFPTSPPLIY